MVPCAPILEVPVSQVAQEVRSTPPSTQRLWHVVGGVNRMGRPNSACPAKAVLNPLTYCEPEEIGQPRCQRVPCASQQP